MSDVHAPLPYLVRVRVVQSPDTPPLILDRSVTAYSALEALEQVVISVESDFADDDETEVVIESVAPDEAEYARRSLGSSEEKT